MCWISSKEVAAQAPAKLNIYRACPTLLHRLPYSHPSRGSSGLVRFDISVLLLSALCLSAIALRSKPTPKTAAGDASSSTAKGRPRSRSMASNCSRPPPVICILYRRKIIGVSPNQQGEDLVHIYTKP